MEKSNGVIRPSADANVKAERKKLSVQFRAQHALVVAFFLLLLVFHALAIYLFCSGFLLSRLVLPDRSQCAVPPTGLQNGYTPGSHETGCWHPKSFDKAVIILVDALRYDFTVPFRPKSADEQPHHFHNALPILYETSVQQPENAFLLPFIADPPTTTLQRLKALTTGSLPTFIDAGSNFAGTSIDEDNLIEQLYLAGKKIVHIGDDTWHSLFPDLFEPNLTRPYPSFDVWDLHSVDDGVNEHLFPLLEPSMNERWDVAIGHYLGVDHAGHRYGPEHPEMNNKLKQMNGLFRRMINALDDRTLLVVMGDHGMDVKGDHGGESDDEVEAALWMYSKRGIFGRSDAAFVEPPSTAKERPVGQIDLVPTLALLLGLPIPFNNLGRPIEEAFIQKAGNDYRNLAEVSRLTSAQIHRYQAEYAKVRNLDESATNPTTTLWSQAGTAWERTSSSLNMLSSSDSWKKAYIALNEYQAENLRICRGLWARFDLVSMSMGIAALLGTFALVLVYSQGLLCDRVDLTPPLLIWGVIGMITGGLIGAAVVPLTSLSATQLSAFGAVLGGLVTSLAALVPARHVLRLPYPRSFWGSLCTIVTLLLCVGFAANSFTIWEDEQLLFFLSTFGILMLGSSLGVSDKIDRNVGILNSISFLLATRISSLSRLCREEQMPICKATYYASEQSSTSASWQLFIPFAVAVTLPSILRYFFVQTQNYQGSAVIWIGIAFRLGLGMVALFWVLDAADNNKWYPQISEDTLKTARVYLAQAVLAITFAAGYGTYIFTAPFLLVRDEDVKAPPTATSKPINSSDPGAPILTTVNEAPAIHTRRTVLGYHNSHGTRYFLLPAIWILAILLVQKPMGQGAMALCIISILNVLEIIDANHLHGSPVGPILFALLGHYYFFKTGHQAALATIQWDAAFIPMKSNRLPWSALVVLLNTYGPQILCAIAVPTIPMWKVVPSTKGLLGRVAGAMTTHVLFYAAIALATVVESAWLRRHLMLYRVFMPRMLMATTLLLLVEFVGAVIAMGAVRWSMVSVGDVFGWAES